MALPPRPLSRTSARLRIAAGFGWAALWLLPTLALAALCLPWRGLRIRVGNLFGKVVGVGCNFVMGIRLNVHGAEHLGAQPAIYLSNHTSTSDVWIGSMLCPFGGCGVAKREIVRVPVFGQVFWLTGHLRIDRGSPERAKAALAELASVVHRHRLSIWIWPEGTRSRDGRLQPLKKGFVHMACASGLPVVPVVVVGAHRRWPARQLRLSTGPVDVHVLPPVDTSAWRPEEAGQRAAEIHALFQAHLPPDQRAEEPQG